MSQWLVVSSNQWLAHCQLCRNSRFHDQRLSPHRKMSPNCLSEKTPNQSRIITLTFSVLKNVFSELARAEWNPSRSLGVGNSVYDLLWHSGTVWRGNNKLVRNNIFWKRKYQTAIKFQFIFSTPIFDISTPADKKCALQVRSSLFLPLFQVKYKFPLLIWLDRGLTRFNRLKTYFYTKFETGHGKFLTEAWQWLVLGPHVIFNLAVVLEDTCWKT